MDKMITIEDFVAELNKIPSEIEYQKNLDELWELTKGKKYNNKELEELYFNKAILIPAFIERLNQLDVNGLEFFRCRTIDEKKENTNLISTFSYPMICKQNGRANITENPVFYCCDHPTVPIYENKSNNGDTVYLSIWKTKFDRNVNMSPLISLKMPKSNPWHFIVKKIINEKNKYGDISNRQKPLYEFINKLYLEEKEPYQLSSWISNYLLYQKNIFDCIIYESVAVNSLHCNWAFHPKIVDRYFSLDRVYKFDNIVYNHKTNKYSNPNKTPTEIGEVTNKNIEWRIFKDKDLVRYPLLKNNNTK